jgi:hypothetical protein
VGVRSARGWLTRHPAALALLAWAAPVVLLAPLVVLLALPVMVVPLLVAGPVIPAVSAYSGARRKLAEDN